MSEMFLVIDESGAKGYSNITEKSAGELGVMAGFLYSEKDINVIKSVIESEIFHKMFMNNKVHITDLDSETQEMLRKKIFLIFRKLRIRWFFKAIYVQGFHQSEFKKDRGGFEAKKSLHVELFHNIYMQSLCMVYSLGIKDLKIKVLSDNLDVGILKQFKKEADNISNLFLRRKRTTYINTRDESGKVHKHEFQTKIISEDIPKFSSISFDIDCKHSALTLSADILANSVHYFLKNNQKSEMGSYLNSKKAIKSHPLVDLAYIPEDFEDLFPITDVTFRRDEL